MNSLLFKKIRYKNLLSSGNVFTEIDLAASPMTLVIGVNGDGKSTIIDALCFVLFNKPFRKINKPQLLNTVTKKELVVEIEFTARGHDYIVRRGMKPALFEVWKDGTLLNQDAKNDDYQAQLEKGILRTNFKTFSQIVILGSASYVPFMQLKTSDRRLIVEDLYDLRIFTSMNSLLKDKLTKSEREIDRLENEKELLEQELTLSTQHQVVRAEDKDKQIRAKQDEIETHNAQRLLIDAQIQTLKEANDKLRPVVDEHRRFELKLQEMANLKSQIEANARSIAKEVSFLRDNEVCPTCQQGIAHDFRERVVNDKDSKLNEIMLGLDQLCDKSARMTVQRDQLAYAKKTINENETSIIVKQHAMTTHASAMKKLGLEINQLLSEQERIIDEAMIVELESRILEQKRLRGKLLAEREMMSYVGVLLKDTGIKAKIVKKYSATFNSLVNAYLAKLDFYVDFHLDEAFEETIRSMGRDSFTYNSFSEGEKLRIDLAVMFAWRDIARMRASLNTNLLIMDEIFDGSMDVLGTEELMKIMKGVTSENNTFVISHSADKISDHFDRTLRFTKTKGFSKIAA